VAARCPGSDDRCCGLQTRAPAHRRSPAEIAARYGRLCWGDNSDVLMALSFVRSVAVVSRFCLLLRLVPASARPGWDVRRPDRHVPTPAGTLRSSS